MRQVVARVHPVSVHAAEILDLQLDQGAGKVFGVAELHGKFIWHIFSVVHRLELELRTSLEFKFSTHNVHQQLHHRVHGCEGVGKEDEANDDGELLVEAERLVERTVVDKDGEEGEDVKCVELKSQEMVCCWPGESLTCEIPSNLVVCPRLQCPSSCANTPTTSSVSLFSIRVS